MSKTSRLTLLGISTIILILATAPAQAEMRYGFRGGLGLASQSTDNTGWVLALYEDVSGVDDEYYVDNFDAGFLTGIQFSAFLNYSLSANFAIQSELLYIQKGVNVEGIGELTYEDINVEHDLRDKIRLAYLEIPVLVKYKIPVQGRLTPSLIAGTALGINVSGRENFSLVFRDLSGSSSNIAVISGKPKITNLKTFDFSLIMGGEFTYLYGSTNIILDVRYTIGLSGLFDDVDPNTIPEYQTDEPFPEEFPIASMLTGRAPDAKSRTLSITLGVSLPM